MVDGGRSGALRAGSGARTRNGLQSVQDQATGLAAVNLFVGIASKLLQSMRQDTHAASAALPIAGFGEARAMMTFGDARVKFTKIFGNRSQGAFALRKQGFELLLFLGLQSFDFFSLFGDRRFVLLQIRFRMPDAAFRFFASHHHFQLRVFGFGHFRFGVQNLVLQGFVRFVGFDGAALVAVFLRAVLPLLHVQLEFLPVFLAVDEALSSGSNGRARAAQLGVGFTDALRKCLNLGSHRGNQVVDTLQLDQVRNGGMHRPLILTQRALRFARRDWAIPGRSRAKYGPLLCIFSSLRGLAYTGQLRAWDSGWANR